MLTIKLLCNRLNQSPASFNFLEKRRRGFPRLHELLCSNASAQGLFVTAWVKLTGSNL